jgi:predicted nucleic acid-binding protein
MSDYLVDTNVLIRCLRGMSESIDCLQQLQDRGELYVSVLSRAEILARMWPDEEKRTLQLLSALVSLPVDQAVADAAGRLLFDQARQGTPMNVPDAIIAATATQQRLTLVSYDAQHFARIPELEVVNPNHR